MTRGCWGSVAGCPVEQEEACRWETGGGCRVGSEERETLCG